MEDGYCVDRDGDSVQSILSSMATTMMMLVLMPKSIVNVSDWGMNWQTSSKDLVAANNEAKRTVSVHAWGWNDDDAGPAMTAVAE